MQVYIQFRGAGPCYTTELFVLWCREWLRRRADGRYIYSNPRATKTNQLSADNGGNLLDRPGSSLIVTRKMRETPAVVDRGCLVRLTRASRDVATCARTFCCMITCGKSAQSRRDADGLNKSRRQLSDKQCATSRQASSRFEM